ncbi:MAG TPA: adenylate/guanylate cyclase domain-containing protein [Chitinophagaceae bacterium]
MSSSRQLAAIMFTDIVGYTALMGRDEQKAFELLDKNRRIQKPIIEQFNGRWIKELGDGVLAQFNSAYDAVQCGVKIQQVARQELESHLRIGIHLGDITNEDNDVFGDGVNVASRIQGIADPGGIYISESVEKAIRNRADITTKYLGEAELKNVDYPVKVFAIQGAGFPMPVFKPKSRKTKRKKVILSLAIFVILAIGGWFIIKKTSKADNASIESLVVLPIANLTGSEEHNYIVAGVHDALITELSHINSLRVISRTSANGYAKSNKSLSAIAKELNVDAIIESSILRADDSIRLNVQLIRIFPNEDHVWADIFDHSLREMLPMISNVTKAITKKIRIVLSPEEEELIVTKKEVDPEIYKLYLRGKYHLQKYNPKDFQEGIKFLNEVIEKDPTFALAYATLSIGYGDLAHLPSAPQDAFPRAKALAVKALELDNTLVEAHTAVAESNLYHDFNFKKSETAFRTAMSIDSNFAPAVTNYGWFLDLFGKKTEAERYLRKAADLDPLAPVYRAWLAWWYWVEKEFDKGIAEAKRVLEMNPGFSVAEMVLGGLYVQTGKIEEGIALTKKAAAANPGLIWAVGWAYAKAGRIDEAKALVDKIEKTPFNAFSLVVIYSELGDKEEAMKWAKVTYDIRHIFTPWLTTGFYAESIMKDPRFVELLKPIIDSLP